MVDTTIHRQQLQKIFGFSDQDLASNQAGQLSEHQRQKMQWGKTLSRGILKAALGFSPIFAGLIFCIVVCLQEFPLPFNLLFASMFLLTIYTLSSTLIGMYKSLRRGTVVTTFISKDLFKPDRRELFVDSGTQIWLSKNQYNLLDQNSFYQVFYWSRPWPSLNGNHTLVLSIELVGPKVQL
jgi:hypothetical protein